MCSVKRVKSEAMFPVVSEILNHGGHAWISVTGMSMYPFLRENRDSVELKAVSFKDINRGDIVLIKRSTGLYVLHRVLKKTDDSFFMIGDAQRWIEGPLEPDQLIAVVCAVRRGRRIIECDNKLWSILVGLWLKIIPLRHIVLKFFSMGSRIKRLIFKNAYTRRNCEN